MGRHINIDRARALLDYDPITGIFTWKKGRKAVGGRRAGCIADRGYVRIKIDGRYQYAHQLAWALVHDSASPSVSHRNKNRADNRLVNLSLSAPDQRGWSAKPKTVATKTSRFKGVYWHRQRSKWCAQISPGRKKHHLGLFDNEIVAAKAYDNALRAIAGEFANTNFPEA